MLQRIIITRHGNRQDFIDPTWRQTANWPDDPPLSVDGFVQARELGMRLRRESIDRIFASPFLRTVQTAHTIAEILDTKVCVEPGLSEWHNQEWFERPPELMPADQRPGEFGRIDQEYSALVHPIHPESFAVMNRRVASTVDAILERYHGTLLFVGHGASVDAASWALAGEGWTVNSSLCCLIAMAKKDGRWIVEINGDTSHLTNPEKSVRLI